MKDDGNIIWVNKSYEISEEEFQRIASLTNRHFGIVLGPDKKALVVNRLQQMLKHKNFRTINEYADYLERSGDVNALKDFACRITTNHTYFYREKAHFNFLSERALPEFCGTKQSNNIFSIWCAGCSSGEEAYTLAVILSEYADKTQCGINARILATDLSEKMIEQAEKGEYREAQLKYMPVLLKYKYFTKISEDTWSVKEELKNMISFSIFNLMSSQYSFKNDFNAVFCRNVLIYFDDKNRNDIISKFSRCQPAGAYLFISHSEVIPQGRHAYEYVIPAVYRNNTGIRTS